MMSNQQYNGCVAPMMNNQCLTENLVRDERSKPYVQPNPLLYCVFCLSANHHSHECWRFKSSTKFWQMVLEQRRCKNCLRLYHRSNKCFNRSFCRVNGCTRPDKHSEILCYGRYVRHKHSPNLYENYPRNSPWLYVSHSYKSSYRMQQTSRNMIPKRLIKESSSSVRSQDVQIQCTLVPPQRNVIASLKNHVSTQTSGFDQLVLLRPSRKEKGCQTVKSQVSVSIQTSEQTSTSFDIIKDTPRHIECEDKKEDTVLKPQIVHGSQVSLTHSNVGKMLKCQIQCILLLQEMLKILEA